MTHFFVDNQIADTGEHTIHAQGCTHMAMDKQYLGRFDSASYAHMEARKTFWRTTRCEFCCFEVSAMSHGGDSRFDITMPGI
jgi:hypothetical protein